MLYVLISMLVFSGFLVPQDSFTQNSSELIEKLAHTKVSSICEECEIIVTPKWIPKKIQHLDSGQITSIQFRDTGLPRGYQTSKIYYREGGETRSKDVQLFIRIEKPLPVVNRRIERNEILSGDDIVFRLKEITRLQRMPLDSIEEIVNLSAAKVIQNGDLIYESDLQKVPVIKPGDVVEMVYTEGGVEVALSCNARQAKAKGEQIRLYSDKTRKTYIGKVINSTKVLWEKTL